MSPIGEGGMGEVWRASHKMLARPAAIKLVKLDASRQELFAQRFHREANAIAGLQSPHTVYLYDFGTTQDGRLYYVMELLDGISLQTLITTFGPQPASRVVAILRQMCRSLEEAHQKKIVHRDLKPSNVMICQVAQALRLREGARLRPREAVRRRRSVYTSDGRGRHAGHARIHGARSGARRARRSTHAPICTRSDASRTSC